MCVLEAQRTAGPCKGPGCSGGLQFANDLENPGLAISRFSQVPIGSPIGTPIGPIKRLNNNLKQLLQDADYDSQGDGPEHSTDHAIF
jgi:hypothetical protein